MPTVEAPRGFATVLPMTRGLFVIVAIPAWCPLTLAVVHGCCGFIWPVAIDRAEFALQPGVESKWDRSCNDSVAAPPDRVYLEILNTPRIGAASQVGSMSSTFSSRKLVERTVGGKQISIETGFLAKQASGSVVVRIGDTMTLVAVVAGPGREGLDFFPLTVDYREKTYAAGKFPGGFIKREGRPTTKARSAANHLRIPSRLITSRYFFRLCSRRYFSRLDRFETIISSPRRLAWSLACVLK